MPSHREGKRPPGAGTPRPSGAQRVLSALRRDSDTRGRVHEAISINRENPDRSLSWSARRGGTTIGAIVRHEPGAVERLPSGRYRVKASDRGLRIMPVISAGVVYPRVAIRGSRQASLIGAHLAAVGTYLNTGDPEPLRYFAGKTVTGTLEDGSSHRFELEANPDEIAELAFTGELADLVVES